jgi:hypothetical protein
MRLEKKLGGIAEVRHHSAEESAPVEGSVQLVRQRL